MRREGCSVRGDRLEHLVDHKGLVHRGRVDLEDLEIVRALELVVHDGWRLEYAVAGAEGLLTLTLVHEPDPALEDVEHLKVTLVLVQASSVHVMSAVGMVLDPDHVGTEFPVRRVLDAEVAVFHEAAQARLVLGAFGPAHTEALLVLTHDWILLDLSGRGAAPPR